MTPFRGTFKRCMDTAGAEAAHSLRKKSRNQKLLCACGEENKGGCHHMVKKISWFHVKDNEFDCAVLDSNACDGIDKYTAYALDCSFMRVDPTNGPKAIIYSQGTDSGDGEQV